MSDDLDRIRADNRLEHIIPALTAQTFKKVGHEWYCKCPFHPDTHPSLRLDVEKQMWFCDRCNEGGDVFRFVEKFRKVDFPAALAELEKTGSAGTARKRGPGKVTAEYLYEDSDGKPTHVVKRKEYDDARDQVTGKPRKEFPIFHLNPAGEWMPGEGPQKPSVYRLSRLRGQRVVYWPEGERCVDTLVEHGLPATTSPGGAMKATLDHAMAVKRAGVQYVVVLPDNDEVGMGHGRKVCDLCRRVGLKVKLCLLPDLPAKGDCVEWFAAGHTKDEMFSVAKATAPYDPSQETAQVGADLYQWRTLDGVGYELNLPRLGINMRLVDVRRHTNGDVTGVLTVRVEFAGAKIIPLTGGIINSSEINVAADRTRRERAKHLAERAQTGDEVDWIALIDMFCVKVMDAEIAGSPEIPLHQIQVGDIASEFVVSVGYPLLRRHPSLWFGDSGTSKSYLALDAAIDMVRSGINTLYGDWEFAGEEHKERGDKLAPAELPKLNGLIYRRFERPFVHEVGRIRDIIAKHNISFFICDSVGFAADGSPESADAATAFYRALRAVGKVGSLLIAHVNRSEQGDQKPFGSVFWANGARNIWYMKRSDVSMSEDEFIVGFYHRKSNLGRLRPPFGVRLKFLPSATIVSSAELREVQELAVKQPLWQRVKQYLEQQNFPVDPEILSSELEVPKGVISKTVNQFDKLFEKKQDGRVGLRLVVPDEHAVGETF